MGICDRAAAAAQGFFSNPIVGGLGQALSAFGAADIAIRLGTGGQAGATDLPGLLNTQGIPCYSPELGDTIYVTPWQWWANGGKCDGLRDPDREAIEERIREVEERARRRNEIRRDHGVEVPPDYGSEYLRELQEFLERNNIRFTNGFGGAGGSIEFLASGNLSIWFSSASVTFGAAGPVTGDGTWNSRRIGDSWASPFPANPNQVIPISRGDKIVRSMSGWISPNGNQQSSEIYWNLIKGDGRSVGIENNRVFHSQNWYGQSQPYPGTTSAARTTSISGTQANLNFDPTTPSGEQTPGSVGSNGIADSIPINTPPPPPPLEEGYCDMGCDCSSIAQGQQAQLADLKRKIDAIYKAVAASKFEAGVFQFSPEQQIELIGRGLYSNPVARNGRVAVSNLADYNNALMGAVWYRLGLQRFPALVPDELIPKTNAAAEALDRDFRQITSLADFLKWFFDQWEASNGQWPSVFKIKDDNKEKIQKIWNQSEMLSEIFGMLLKVVEDADIGVQFGTRATAEAAGAKIAATKALFAVEQIIEGMGLLTEKKWVDIDLSFTPDPFGDNSKPEEMLKPSKKQIDVMDIVDGRSLLGVLLNINYWALRAGLALSGDSTPNPFSNRQSPFVPGDSIREARKKERSQARGFGKKWDKFKQDTKTKGFAANQQPGNTQPRGGFPKPDLQEIANPNTPTT